MIQSGEEIDQATLDFVIRSFNEIFNHGIASTTDGNILFESLLQQLKIKSNAIGDLENSYYGAYPFGACFNEAFKRLTGRDPEV
ncbi:MAG: hypothetical protein HGB17_12680 [Syntrophobacteraceae bacterium]|nr:hypothetical protein [Syntrophobacteraceae bacterium]